MNAWPDRRILNLLGVELPIILAPMAGPGTAELAVANPMRKVIACA